MKKTTFFVLSLLLEASLPSFGLNYNIAFTGSGVSTSVGGVVVQNLTKGTTVNIPTGNVLNLSDAPTAVEQLNAKEEIIRIYPNSVEGTSTFSFFAKQAGSTRINIYSLDGKKVVSITQNLKAGSNSFHLSLNRGSYVIQVIGNKYKYSAKMMNQSTSRGKLEIAYIGTEKPLSTTPQKSRSSALGTTTMTYTTGDRLLYKGTSGNYCTVVTDVPTASKTINFVFAACMDADGNNYRIVKIGSQTWMAENLKTTKYNDGTTIPYVTNQTAWSNLSTPAYCWYDNATTNKNTYGALYNWYTVNTNKLVPAGWHIPTDAEWTILENYLMANGYNYNGTLTGNNYAKSLALSSVDWSPTRSIGAVGNNDYPTKFNTTGFSALPSGHRSSNGTFYYDGFSCGWWSTTETGAKFAWNRWLYYDYSSVNNSGNNEKVNGFSIRCLKD